MTARTYDPFAIERPKLKLGVHGEWDLGEMHDARYAKFQDWHARFVALTENDESSISDFADVIGELIAVSCIDAGDAKAVLVDLCDESVHGEQARGMQTLLGIVKFLVDYSAGEVTAGEG